MKFQNSIEQQGLVTDHTSKLKPLVLRPRPRKRPCLYGLALFQNQYHVCACLYKSETKSTAMVHSAQTISANSLNTRLSFADVGWPNHEVGGLQCETEMIV